MGFAENNIHMKGFSGAEIYDAMGVRGNDADMGVNMGWCSDYPDPYDWINILLYGKGDSGAEQRQLLLHERREVEQEDGSGCQARGATKRLTTYGKLDIDITKQVCTDGNRAHVQQPVPLLQPGESEEPVYQGIYQDLSIPALALK